jgi:hypothetical protein
MNKFRMIQCLNCGIEKETNQPKTKFCGRNCKQDHYRRYPKTKALKPIEESINIIEQPITKQEVFISENKEVVVRNPYENHINPHEFYDPDGKMCDWVKKMREQFADAAMRSARKRQGWQEG